MARLIGHLVQDYPASRPLLGGASFIYRGRVHSRRIPLFQDPGGVQALKTGFTREAGYNLAIAAWRAGQRFLLIVLGSQTRSLSFRDAQQLLRYGFAETGMGTADEQPRRPAPPPARRPPDRRRHAAVAVGLTAPVSKPLARGLRQGDSPWPDPRPSSSTPTAPSSTSTPWSKPGAP